MPQDSQINASNPSYNVCVNASAGSGKTKVLVDRFLRLLLSGTSPDNILCITYTNTAADEMLSRIKYKLISWHHANIEEIEAELEALAIHPTREIVHIAKDLYSKILKVNATFRITTVHSFAMEILGRDLSVERLIVDTRTQSLILFELIDDLFYHPSKYGFSEKITSAVSYMNLYTIKNRIMDILLFHYIQADGYFAGFESEIELVTHLGQRHAIKPEFHLEQIIINNWLECLIKEKNTLRKYGEFDETFQMLYQASIDKDQSFMFKASINILLTQEGEKRKRLLKANVILQYPELEDYVRSLQDKLYSCMSELQHYLSSIKNVIVISLSYTIHSIYKALLQKKGFSTYDTVLLDAIKMLQSYNTANEVLYYIDCRIDHILIDEAQDISPKQWLMIKLIADEFFVGESARQMNRTIFIVGDPKQSIYSFQGANPLHFAHYTNYFKQKAQDICADFVNITLDKSFRTRSEILDLVDAYFVRHHNFAFNSEEYNGHISHHGNGGIVTINKVETKEDLPSTICQLISNLIDGGANPHSIMILVRSRNSIEKKLREELDFRGIKYTTPQVFFLNDCAFYKDMLTFANFLATAYDERKSIANNLIYSKFFYKPEYDEFIIRASKLGIDLCDYMGDQYAEISALILNAASSTTVIGFYSRLINGMELSRLYGQHVFAEIDAFFELVELFEKMSYTGSLWESFYTYAINSKIPIKGFNNDYAPDAIRIMTCHGAKGLEAKIVIIADASYSDVAPFEAVLWSQFGEPYIYTANPDHVTRKIFDEVKMLEQKESMRLLYVAMTRARDELHIFGSADSRSKTNWYNMLIN